MCLAIDYREELARQRQKQEQTQQPPLSSGHGLVEFIAISRRPNLLTGLVKRVEKIERILNRLIISTSTGTPDEALLAEAAKKLKELEGFIYRASRDSAAASKLISILRSDIASMLASKGAIGIEILKGLKRHGW